jgi:ribonuclease BN (tRNA processing enzyme)
MEIRVLGCQGGILPGYKSAAFLINGEILIDAGSVANELSLTEQDRVRDIFITHFHLDHTKDIAFLSDNAVGRPNLPITIHGTEQTVSDFKTLFFNDHLWPDFTEIYSHGKPIVSLSPFVVGDRITAGEVEVSSFRVEHNMDSVGYRVSQGDSSVIFSGDTGPTGELWDVANDDAHLKAIFLETSFPNELQEIADMSAHLTPKTLAAELTKLKREKIPVYVYHLKPRFIDELARQIGEIQHNEINILENDQVLRF